MRPRCSSAPCLLCRLDLLRCRRASYATVHGQDLPVRHLHHGTISRVHRPTLRQLRLLRRGLSLGCGGCRALRLLPVPHPLRRRRCKRGLWTLVHTGQPRVDVGIVRVDSRCLCRGHRPEGMEVREVVREFVPHAWDFIGGLRAGRSRLRLHCRLRLLLEDLRHGRSSGGPLRRGRLRPSLIRRSRSALVGRSRKRRSP